jgi:hypothetical protein
MALLRMKVDEETFEVDLDKLTLGEARLLKHDYGMSDLREFSFWDPDQMAGLFVIAVKRAHPDMSEADVLAKVEGVDAGTVLEDLQKQVEAAVQAAEQDPTPAGSTDGTASEADLGPETAGSPETTPATAGAPS